jgi:hypothetical protein
MATQFANHMNQRKRFQKSLLKGNCLLKSGHESKSGSLSIVGDLIRVPLTTKTSELSIELLVNLQIQQATNTYFVLEDRILFFFKHSKARLQFYRRFSVGGIYRVVQKFMESLTCFNFRFNLGLTVLNQV